MIVFQNHGVIDMRAIKTFGVSVKKEGSIGFFGTGLKYAIAILLRENCVINIYSGGEEYKFDLVKTQITGQEFNIVRMNGEELGFTTELGKTWELWKAIREIYCNCTDEEGEIYETDGLIKNINSNNTIVTIDGENAKTIYNNIDSFILQKKPKFTMPTLEIHGGETHSIFYKRVRVTDREKHCIFTYNIINGDIDLTEDRTAKYAFQLRRKICEGIVSCEDEDAIEQIICAPKHTFEHEDLDYDISKTPSQQFLNVAARMITMREYRANKSALDYANKYMDISDEPEEMALTNVQKNMLKKATEMLLRAGYEVNNYPLLCVQYLGNNMIGLAKRGKIYISELAFQKGTKEVAATLLEEFLHLSKNLEDESRSFQNYLFGELLSKIEELQGEAF